MRTVRSFSKANPKFDFWRAKKGRFWPKLRPKRTIYTAVITAHEPPSVVTIGLPTKNNFSNFNEASPQQAAGYQTEGHCRGDTTVSPPSSLCKVTSQQAPRNLLIQ